MNLKILFAKIGLTILLIVLVCSMTFLLGSCAEGGGSEDETTIESESESESATEEESETPSEETSETPSEEISEALTEVDLSEYDIDFALEEKFGVSFLPVIESVKATGSVYVRSEPSFDNAGNIVGALTAGSEVTRIGYDKAFSRILFEGKVRYVSSKYLDSAHEEESGEVGKRYEGSGENAKFVIVIDAGHQKFAMTDTEPDGPGSSTMKMKVTAGTMGVATGKYESELNLEVALKLRDILKEKGYTVIMVRESQNVEVSNSERAKIANDAHADVFIRIHANGDSNSELRGAMTVCQTPRNPYNADIYADCRALSDALLDSFCASTGISKRSVWETDTMSGTNWASVVTTIIEMGFMSNPDEDRLMAGDGFAELAAKGISDGIEKYLESKSK